MLGHFDPHDACLGSWAAELLTAARTLASGDPSRYVSDEGEQGQPAYVFEGPGDTVTLPVAKSEIGDGEGIPECGGETFDFLSLVAQVRRLYEDLRLWLDRAAPGKAERWLDHHAIRPLPR
jgi:hypothetical protein